jgi:hypothetical protein
VCGQKKAERNSHVPSKVLKMRAVIGVLLDLVLET